MNPVPPMPIDPAAGARLAQALAGERGTSAASGKELVQAAKDFESVLLDRLFQEMKRTIPKSELLGGAAGEQVWDLFWSQLARDVASRGGMGLWKQVVQQFGAGSAAGAADAPNAADLECKP